MNASSVSNTVKKCIAVGAAALIGSVLLVASPAHAEDFKRDAQVFDSVPMDPVAVGDTAFADDAPTWTGPESFLSQSMGLLADASASATANSGGEGDWTATDLSSAGSWSHGGSSGAYSYTYGMRIPPSSGPAPGLNLSYSSASHDGRTSGSNNQASWIGDGWDYSPGLIERSYTSCAAESEDDGNNSDTPTADLCWRGESPSVTLSLNGVNASLVLDDTTGKWRTASDANWRIELLGSPATGSSSTSERWRVTTTDGTQYYFAGEASSSNSRWTVPVFGNHSGEPCFKSGDFEGSRCAQAYRWMLDKVVDVHGNMSRYYYATETGYYAPVLGDKATASYTRSGWITRIEYGLRDGGSSTATGRVVFTTEDRCLSSCRDSASVPKEERWPDTPWDLHCASGADCDQYSPVFFSTKRLTSIATEVAGGSGFRKVDSWALEHEFKDYGNENQVVLWLKSVQHTGHVGGTQTMPKVVFGGTFMENRVETGNGRPAIWRPRLTSIKNETGAVTTINYSDPDCGEGDLPSSAHNNTRRCFPVRYVPEGMNEAKEEYFQKYVVSSIVDTDTTGGADAVWTFYDYASTGGGTGVLWAWDDSEFTADEDRTYGQWRGYSQVTVRVGDPTDPEPQLRSRTRYYRGMDAQPLPSGSTRSVSVTDSQGNTATDHRALAGNVWEEASYDNTTIIGSATTWYWTKKTATRAHDGGDLEAWMTAPRRTDSRTKLSSTSWRTARYDVTYDDYGRATTVNEHGDTGISGDERCIRTHYTANTAKWILETASRVETVSVPCSTSPSRPAHVVKDVRSYYDGATSHTAVPARGLMTKAETLDGWNNGPVYVTLAESTFDAIGREMSVTDALGATTTTTYNPSGAGPTTGMTVTNALGHVSSATFEPAWGAPTETINSNGKPTTISYDPVGRRTAVWLPGRAAGTKTPHLKFAYKVSQTAPSTVTTESIIHNETYLKKIELYDALLRPRQVQADTYEGRLVTQSVYNSRGQVAYTSDAHFNNESGPTDTLVWISRTNDEARTEYAYDGAGRVTDTALVIKDEEHSRVRYSYGGHNVHWRTAVTPPEGGTASATLEDARGRTVELRQYQAATPTGTYDATTYSYTANGLIESVTDPVGNRWAFEYDLRGRRVATDDPDSGRSMAEYNEVGQLTSATTANGTTLSFAYDALGRRTERWEGDLGTGTLLSEWRYDGAVDGIGMPQWSINWVDGEQWATEAKKYTPDGKPTAVFTYVPDSAGPIAGAYQQSFTYNTDGSLKTSRAAGVGDLRPETMNYGYDKMGMPGRVTSTGPDFGTGRVYVDAVEYSPYGQMLQRKLGDPALVGGTSGQVWQTWIYEQGTGRLAEFYFDKDTAGPYDGSKYGIAALSYEYDQVGNILSIADEPVHTSDALQPERQCFQYDHLRRLTDAWAQAGTGACVASPSSSDIGGPGAYRSTYSYDKTGNRVSEQRWSAAGTASYTYGYPAPGGDHPHALNEVTSTANGGERTVFTYDAAGFTTSIDRDGDLSLLNWGPTGRLDTIESGEEVTRFIDDADGNRIMRIDPDGDMTAWVAGYEIHHNATLNTIEPTRYYEHAGSMIGLRVGKGDIQWVTGDHHGTGQWIVNGDTLTATVRRFDPFGNERGLKLGTWPDERGFVGGITNDGVGLTTIGAREYDPLYGRFISVDPIADWANPQQLNGYAYASNNPVVKSDPSGLIETLCQPGGGGCKGNGTPAENGYGPPKPPTRTNGGDGPGNGNSPADSLGLEEGWEYGPDVMDQHCYNFLGPGANPHGGGCFPPVPTELAWDWDTFQIYCAYYSIPQWVCSQIAPDYAAPYDSTAAEQLIYELVAEDYVECGKGDVGACVWTGIGYVPVGGWIAKGGKGLWKSLKKVFKSCKSFVPGTLVVMADGTSKPIEDIEAGEQVLAVDILTGEVEGATVSDTVVTPEQLRNLVTIGVAGGGDGEVEGTATATAGHAFWVAEPGSEPWNGDPAEWVHAASLEPGSWLQTSAGTWVQAVSIEAHAEETTTHNLTVAGLHTYFVSAGSTNLLNHNCGTTAGEIVNFSPIHGIDPDKARELRSLSNDDLLKTFNDPLDGGKVLVTEDGRIFNGHHRIAELQRRIEMGEISPNVYIEYEIYRPGGGGVSDGFWDW